MVTIALCVGALPLIIIENSGGYQRDRAHAALALRGERIS
jgi:hypothetical protein